MWTTLSLITIHVKSHLLELFTIFISETVIQKLSKDKAKFVPGAGKTALLMKALICHFCLNL